MCVCVCARVLRAHVVCCVVFVLCCAVLCVCRVSVLACGFVQVTRTQWAPSCVLLLGDVPLNAHPMAATEHSLLGEAAREMANQWCVSLPRAHTRVGLVHPSPCADLVVVVVGPAFAHRISSPIAPPASYGLGFPHGVGARLTFASYACVLSLLVTRFASMLSTFRNAITQAVAASERVMVRCRGLPCCCCHPWLWVLPLAVHRPPCHTHSVTHLSAMVHPHTQHRAKPSTTLPHATHTPRQARTCTHAKSTTTTHDLCFCDALPVPTPWTQCACRQD